MPTRSDTTESVALALEILRRIPRRGKITARQMAEQLRDAGIERDLRTIQRQLNLLSERFGIERDNRSRPYGYRWLERTRPLMLWTLTPQESVLLRLAEEHLRHLLPARLMNSLTPLFTEARRNLSQDEQARLEREWPGKVRVVASTQPLLPPPIAAGVFETVSEALFANHWLHLDYSNADGKSTSFEVMPLGLAQQGPRLYLVCRFRGYDNERTLAVHRIRKAEKRPEQFARPADFDLKRYDDDGRFGFGEGRRIRLVFRIDRAAGLHLTESRLSADQTVTELVDGRLEVTATVVESAMLDWWLRGFGAALTEVSRSPA
jgi:predicted DNA-binding transcriptional regulator YafY